MANAVVVKFTKHGSALNVKDLKAAAAVDQAFNSKNGGKFMKKLLDNCEEFKDINSKLNEAYTWHKNHTMPYLDNGMRMCNVEFVDAYISKINEFKSELQALMGALEPVYSQAVTDDVARLGGLGNFSDYPTWDQIKYKYSIDVKQFPVPRVEDFRFAVSDSVKKELEDVLSEAKIQGRGELFERARKVVTALKETSEKTEKTRRTESSIDNIKDLADVMNILNVHDDAEVRYLAEGLREVINGITIWDLRNSDSARSLVVERCSKFLRQVSNEGFTPPEEDVQQEPTVVESNELLDSLV